MDESNTALGKIVLRHEVRRQSTPQKKDVYNMKKKVWVPLRLKIIGDVVKVTKSPPTKQFGGGDGAQWNSQNVTWG